MIQKIYLYLVSFATLMMVVGGSVGVFMSVADILFPNHYHETFEEYKMHAKHQYEYDEKTKSEKRIETEKSEEELKEDYENMIASQTERQKDHAKNSLIKSFGWILIPLPIFLYFNKQRKLVDGKE
jgi:hypothetical protein